MKRFLVLQNLAGLKSLRYKSFTGALCFCSVMSSESPRGISRQVSITMPILNAETEREA